LNERYTLFAGKPNKLIAAKIRGAREELGLNEEMKPLTRPGIQTTIKVLCHRAGITGTKCGPHTFRHTAAVNYLRNDGDLKTLQIMLGHRKIATTMIYLQFMGAEDMCKRHRRDSPVYNLLK
jgi:site-specific recombinase XerD